MGGATIWPVPRALDAEAHQYPRMWKRNMFFLYSGAFLIAIQLNRYCALCRVSHSRTNRDSKVLTDIFSSFSNQRCAQESTWTGAATTHPRESGSTESAFQKTTTSLQNKLQDDLNCYLKQEKLDLFFTLCYSLISSWRFCFAAPWRHPLSWINMF